MRRRIWFPILLLTVSALAGMPARADTIGIACPAQAAASSAVSCTVTLSLGPDAATNLTFAVSVTPNGSAPALSSGHVTFTDAIGGAFANNGGTANSVGMVYAGLSPAITGTVTAGSIKFTLPAASSGQSYAATITGASAENGNSGNATVPLTIGPPATVSISGNSSPAPQTITFPAIAGVTLGVGPFALQATASSGLAVTYTSNSTSVCTVAGSTVTVLAAGTCSITASQAGNSTYAAATPVTQSFAVSAASAGALSITTAHSSNNVLLAGFTGGSYAQDLTATGGTPPYMWSIPSGTLPAGLQLSGSTISGSPTAVGTSAFTIKVTDSTGAVTSAVFMLPVVAGTGGSAPVRIGALPQFAAGGSWDTTIWLVNTSSSTALPVRLNLYSDDGTQVLKNTGGSTPTATALTITQQGDVQTTTATTIDRVLNPNTSLIISCGLSQAVNVQGWIDVLAGGASASVNGFAVFRYAPGGFSQGASGFVTPWEGTVPLQTLATASSITLPFDNTGGFNNGIALGTLAGAAGTVTANFYDANGNALGSPQAIPLPANGHTSFLLYLNYPFTANQKGMAVFTGTGLIGLGLRASPYGTLTSVPTVLH